MLSLLLENLLNRLIEWYTRPPATYVRLSKLNPENRGYDDHQHL